MKLTIFDNFDQLRERFNFSVATPAGFGAEGSQEQNNTKLLTYFLLSLKGDVLEIGTGDGSTAALLAAAAADSIVYTLDLPGLEESTGQATKEMKNVHRHFAPSSSWAVPSHVSGLSIIFYDGELSKENIAVDSRRYFPRLREGGVIFWNHFDPFAKNPAVDSVIAGLDLFLSTMPDDSELFHLRGTTLGFMFRPQKSEANYFKLGQTPRNRTEKQQETFSREHRIVWAYPATSPRVVHALVAFEKRMASLGFQITTFPLHCPGTVWSSTRLEQAYRAGDETLLGQYERLSALTNEADLLVAVDGAILHPEFLRQLEIKSFFYETSELSDVVTKGLLSCYDVIGTTNPAAVERYQEWGCPNVNWIFHGLPANPRVSEQSIRMAPRELDLIFIGDRYFLGSERVQKLEELHKYFPEATIRGPGWPLGDVEDRNEWLERAKVGWNFHSTRGALNRRLLELALNGVCQLCDNKENLQPIFTVGLEIDSFDTIKECVDKTRYYLAHEAERKEMAVNAWKRATADYTEELMVGRILAACFGTAQRSVSPSKGGSPIRLHLGCGAKRLDDYFNVDIDASANPDLQINFLEINQAFEKGSVSEILIVHAFETLSYKDSLTLIKHCREILAPGGKLVIECPNLEGCIKQIEHNIGNREAYFEGLKGIYSLDNDRFPIRFAWTPWHLKAELEERGFINIQILPPKMHLAWRDMRVEAEQPRT